MGINMVSPFCEMQMEFRYDRDEEKLRVMREVQRITKHSFVEGTSSVGECVIQRDVMEENEKQYELIKLFETLTCRAIPTQSRGGVSDANVVAFQGVTTIDGFGPFGDGDHTRKERALKSSFDSRIEMMSRILVHFQKRSG